MLLWGTYKCIHRRYYAPIVSLLPSGLRGAIYGRGIDTKLLPKYETFNKSKNRQISF